MNKSKLQELCHKESWPLPEYTAVREGPDHDSRFAATVTVNGATFQTPPGQCRSSKEAQNLAAKLAYKHFTASKAVLQAHSLLTNSEFPQPFPGFSTTHAKLNMKPSVNGILMPTKEEKVGNCRAKQTSSNHEDNTRSSVNLYKSRLQNYAQKRNLTLPMYSCEINGPPHARRFKAKVTISGNTYEAPEFFSTLKEAEHAAAKIAFESLPPDDIEEDEGLYKTLLQELAQKRGFRFPVYDTAKSGPPHMPIFVSAVEIGDGVFKGQEAKTKKQAEMSAAKVAYSSLIEGRAGRNDTVVSAGSPGFQSMGALVVSSSNLESLNNELQSKVTPIVGEVVPDINAKADLSNERDEVENGQGATKDAVLPPGSDNVGFPQAISSGLQTVVTKELQAQVLPNVTDEMEMDVRPKEDLIHDEQTEKNEGPDVNIKRHKCSSPDDISPLPFESPSRCATEFRTTRPARQKVLIRPFKPNVTYTDGPIILMDDKWVAMSVDVDRNQ